MPVPKKCDMKNCKLRQLFQQKIMLHLLFEMNISDIKSEPFCAHIKSYAH